MASFQCLFRQTGQTGRGRGQVPRWFEAEEANGFLVAQTSRVEPENSLKSLKSPAGPSSTQKGDTELILGILKIRGKFDGAFQGPYGQPWVVQSKVVDPKGIKCLRHLLTS